MFVPFKAPVTTLAPSICKLSNKLLSDSENPPQTTSAYFRDERIKDLNKTSSVQRLKLYFNGFRRFNFLEAFWWIFNICPRQDNLEDKVKPRCSWTVTSSVIVLCKIKEGRNRLICFCRKNNWFSLSLIDSHQPPFSRIRYWCQVMIKLRSAITRRLNFFLQKAIICK